MPFTPASPLVWCEIPVTDMDKAVAFYTAVFDYPLSIDTSGPNPMAMLPYEGNGTAGHIYPGKPAAAGTGPTVHLTVADTVEAAAERVTAAGGTVVSPAIEIPAGRFIYITDPDGNSVGLFEPKG